jgi:hypothetical protein
MQDELDLRGAREEISRLCDVVEARDLQYREIAGRATEAVRLIAENALTTLSLLHIARHQPPHVRQHFDTLCWSLSQLLGVNIGKASEQERLHLLRWWSMSSEEQDFVRSVRLTPGGKFPYAPRINDASTWEAPIRHGYVKYLGDYRWAPADWEPQEQEITQ